MKGIYTRAIFKLTLCLAIFCAVSSVQAQLTYGAKGDLSLSWMPFIAQTTTTWDGVSFPAEDAKGWTSQPGLGIQLGGWARQQIWGKLFAEAQLTYAHASGRYKFTGPVSGSNYVFRIGQRLGGLSLPLMVGIGTSWADMMVGLQANAYLSNSRRYVGHVEGEKPIEESIGRGGPINPFDFGLRFGLTTAISNRFSIEAGYFHGLTDAYFGNNPIAVMKLRQITYGFRYRIGSVRW